MTELSISLTCDCNVGKIYSSAQTFRKHLQSKRHLDWLAAKENKNFQQELLRAQNQITALKAEILRLRNLLENPKKRNVSACKKKEVAAFQSWKCNECGEMLRANFEVDHILPLSQGGNNEFHNLSALCQPCHKEKTKNDFSDC